MSEFHFVLNVEAPSREIAEDCMARAAYFLGKFSEITLGAMAVKDGDGLFPAPRREDVPKPYGLHDGPTNRLPDDAEPKTIDLMKVLTDSLARREDAAGAGHHAPHAKRYGLTVEDGLSCIEPKGNGNYVRFEDYETLRRQYDATIEGYRAALSTAERERNESESRLREAEDAWAAATAVTFCELRENVRVYQVPGGVWDRFARVLGRWASLARVPSGGET